MPEWQDFLSGTGDFSSYMLEASPAMAYFSSAPFSVHTSPAEQRYWQGQYGNVSNQYMGAMGEALRTGTQEPSFTQFLEDMPWTSRYSALSPALRGEAFSRFSPQARYIYT